MRCVLISLPPKDIQALCEGRQYVVLSRPIRKPEYKPLEILIYSSMSAGGSGLVEAKGFVGRCSYFSSRSADEDLKLNASSYGVGIDDRAPGARYYQEVMQFHMLETPVKLEECISRGSTNPPQKDWKYIQTGDNHAGIYPKSRFEVLES